MKRAVAAVLLAAGLAGAPCAADDLSDAKSALEREDYAAALRAAKRVLSDNRRSVEGQYVAGVAALRLGRLDRAETHLKAAHRIRPEKPDVASLLGETLLLQARDFRARGKEKIANELFEESLEFFDSELARSPEHPGALSGRARALAETGRDGEAIEAYEAWIRARPDDAEAHAALVRLYSERRMAAEAMAALEKIPAPAREENPAAFFAAARVQYEKRADDAGHRLLQEASRLFPGSPDIAALEALDHAAFDRPFRAAEALLRYLDSEPAPEELELVVKLFHDRYDDLVRERGSSSDRGGKSDEVLPKLTLRVEPEFPADAARYAVSGEVELLALVRADGVPGRVLVVSVDVSDRPMVYEKQFRNAAVAAVRQWRYSPALRAGEPRAFPVPVRLEFDAGSR